jgi:hypothetical protein
MDQDSDCCWICLCGEEAGELASVCSCPRRVHEKCLARWQLHSAGRRWVMRLTQNTGRFPESTSCKASSILKFKSTYSLLVLLDRPISRWTVSGLLCLFVSIGVLQLRVGSDGCVDGYSAQVMHGRSQLALLEPWLVAQLSCVAGMLTPYYSEGSHYEGQRCAPGSQTSQCFGPRLMAGHAE